MKLKKLRLKKEYDHNGYAYTINGLVVNEELFISRFSKEIVFYNKNSRKHGIEVIIKRSKKKKNKDS